MVKQTSKKKILNLVCVTFLFITLFSFVSASDIETNLACGGDDELMIGCIGDNEISFFGKGDTTAPVITLVSPAHQTSTTTVSHNFMYDVSDESDIESCSLILDNIVISTEDNVSTSETNTFAVSSLSRTTHTWSINCTDIFDNMGNSSEYTLIINAAPTTSTTTSSSSSGGGGGAAATSPSKFSVEPEEYEKEMVINRISFDKITIINEGNTVGQYSISVEVISDMVTFEEQTITIEPGETKNAEFKITSPKEPGIYTGKIIIGSGSLKKEILVVINIQTEESLFDIIVSIPLQMKVMGMGHNLIAQISLLEMGFKEQKDVTLNYIIKDFDGKIYLSESETIAVADKKVLDKEFFTSNLPFGEYILGVELIYPDGIAVASSHFKISEGIVINTNEILMVVVILIGLFIMIVIGLRIKRYKRMAKHIK